MTSTTPATWAQIKTAAMRIADNIVQITAKQPTTSGFVALKFAPNIMPFAAAAPEHTIPIQAQTTTRMSIPPISVFA